jgi:hypothetical protein
VAKFGVNIGIQFFDFCVNPTGTEPNYRERTIAYKAK